MKSGGFEEGPWTRLGAEKERLVAFIRTTDTSSSPGEFEVVRLDLERVANKEREVQAKLAALSSASEPALPTVAEIMTCVVDVEARIKDDPTTAREAVRQVLIDGKITLTPQPDGSWQVASMLIVGRLACENEKTPERRTVRGFVGDALQPRL